MKSITDSYSSIMIKEISKQKEKIILDQLNERISRNLLVVETQPVLIHNIDPDTREPKVELKQQVRLVLKDQEYIEKLENENRELKENLDRISELLGPYLKEE